MKNLIVIGVISSLLISCAIFSKQKNNDNINTTKEIIIDNSYKQEKNNIEVLSLKIETNLLYITVKSETACNYDDFNLYTTDKVLKSLPPKKVLSLEHISKNEECEEKLNKVLVFNIEKLSVTTYKELVLLLKDKSVSLIK